MTKQKKIVNVLLLLFGTTWLLCFCCPQPVHGESRGSENKGRLKRFQVEIYGGVSGLNPGDLNLLPAAEEQVRYFFYEEYSRYLEEKGDISGWGKYAVGKYKKIGWGVPWGVRARYRLNRVFSLSLGVKFLGKEQVSDPSYQYVKYYDGAFYDQRIYHDYRLGVESVSPLLGLHLGKELSDNLAGEIYIAVGPLVARCSHTSRWNGRFYEKSMGENIVYYQGALSLTEQGKGTGLSIDGGARLEVALGKSLGLFFEAGYTYQYAAGLSGPGSEKLAGNTVNWEGEWVVVSERIRTQWGELFLEYPSNRKPLEEYQESRDFRLDLSGFQLRAGLSLRF